MKNPRKPRLPSLGVGGTEGVPVELASLLVRCLRRGGTGDSNSYKYILQVIYTGLIILLVHVGVTRSQMIHDILVGTVGCSHGTHHYLNDVCDDDDVVHEIVVDDESIYNNIFYTYTDDILTNLPIRRVVITMSTMMMSSAMTSSMISISTMMRVPSMKSPFSARTIISTICC